MIVIGRIDLFLPYIFCVSNTDTVTVLFSTCLVMLLSCLVCVLLQESNDGPKERLLGHGLAGISRREARNARIAVRQLVSAEVGASTFKKTRSRCTVRLFQECGWLIGKRGNKIHKLREAWQK